MYIVLNIYIKNILHLLKIHFKVRNVFFLPLKYILFYSLAKKKSLGL